MLGIIFLQMSLMNCLLVEYTCSTTAKINASTVSIVSLQITSLCSVLRQYVRAGSTTSIPAENVCSVPQGSILGPILFLLSLIEDHTLNSRLYADDVPICGFFSPSALLWLQKDIYSCIYDVTMRMCSNRLQLNSTKTEILWSTIGRRFHQLPLSLLQGGSDHNAPFSMVLVRDLGIHFDLDISLRSHIVK